MVRIHSAACVSLRAKWCGIRRITGPPYSSTALSDCADDKLCYSFSLSCHATAAPRKPQFTYRPEVRYGQSTVPRSGREVRLISFLSESVRCDSVCGGIEARATVLDILLYGTYQHCIPDNMSVTHQCRTVKMKHEWVNQCMHA